MPAERFFTNSDLKTAQQVYLQETEHHHLAHVMKVTVGEEVELVNGRGMVAKGKLIALTKHQATLTIVSITEEPILPPKVILAIPFLRPSKLELIIEKGTELGADAFWFFPAAHSEKRSLTDHQLDRLRHILISALKQCGRLDLPSMEQFTHFEDLFKREGTFLFGDTRKDAPPIQSGDKRPTIFISGPERGFTVEEVRFLEQKAKGVTLHKNILRAETAPIVALLRLQS